MYSKWARWLWGILVMQLVEEAGAAQWSRIRTSWLEEHRGLLGIGRHYALHRSSEAELLVMVTLLHVVAKKVVDAALEAQATRPKKMGIEYGNTMRFLRLASAAQECIWVAMQMKKH